MGDKAHTIPEPPEGLRRPTTPRPYGMWCWSATPDRARRLWWKLSR